MTPEQSLDRDISRGLIPSHIPKITDLLDRLTTDAANLPGRSDLQFHRTLDRGFAKELDGTGERLLELTDRLVELAQADEARAKEAHERGLASAGTQRGPSVASASVKKDRKGKARAIKDEEDVTENFKRTVGDALDAILESADKALDQASGAIKAAKVAIDPRKAAVASRKLPGPFAPTSAYLPENLRNANVPKPQFLFPDAVDNTPGKRWKPTLTTKAHAMVPLDYTPPPVAPFSNRVPKVSNPPTAAQEKLLKAHKRANDRYKRQAKERAHPYWYETEHLQYPTRMFEIAPPIPPAVIDAKADAQGDTGEGDGMVFVDTPEVLSVMVEELKEAKEIAVDLEYHATRSYYGFTCLMQFSTRERDWVVDAIKLRGELREGKLGGVMADPGIVKVFHGAGSDIVWLQQDFDIYVVNLFDTYHATHVLNHSSHSLAGLLSRYCKIVPDKRYQRADWRIRPLPLPMLEYARSDTHYLLYIYDNLRNELLEIASRPSSPVPFLIAPQSTAVPISSTALGVGSIPPSSKDIELDLEQDHNSDLDESSTPDIAPAILPPTPIPAVPQSSGSGTRTGTPETNPQRALRQVLELSAETALNLYEKDDYNIETGTGSAGWKAARKKLLPRSEYTSLEGFVLVRVHQWRDRVGRERDENPYHILPNHLIRNIAAQTLPTLTFVQKIAKSGRALVDEPNTGSGAAPISLAQDVHNVVVAARKEYEGLSKRDLMRILTPGEMEDEEGEGVVTAVEPPTGGTRGALNGPSGLLSGQRNSFGTKSVPVSASARVPAAGAAAKSKAKASVGAKSKAQSGFDDGLWETIKLNRADAVAAAKARGVETETSPPRSTSPGPGPDPSISPGPSPSKKTKLAVKAAGPVKKGSALFGKSIPVKKQFGLRAASPPPPAHAPAPTHAHAQETPGSASESETRTTGAANHVVKGVKGKPKGSALFGGTIGKKPNSKAFGLDASARTSTRERSPSPERVSRGEDFDTVNQEVVAGISRISRTGALTAYDPPTGGTSESHVNATLASTAAPTPAPPVSNIDGAAVVPESGEARPVPSAPENSQQNMPSKKDGVVQVKKVKKKKVKTAMLSADNANPSTQSVESSLYAIDAGPSESTVTAATSTPSKKSKKIGKKGAVVKEDIPEFDYSLHPDILSGPGAALAGGGSGQAEKTRKERKKEKRDKAKGPPSTFIETPDFGPRPKDMTGPKAGARSHTFTS